MRAACDQLQWINMAPVVKGEGAWDRHGLPPTAKARAKELGDRKHLVEYSPLDGLRGPHRTQILRRFGPLRLLSASQETEDPSQITREEVRSRAGQNDRPVGALVGLAVGDALGAPLEFIDAVNSKSDANFVEIVQGELRYVGAYNQFSLKPGQWTDDTSMALCLADSLLQSGSRIFNAQPLPSADTAGYNGSDLRARFFVWWELGYNNGFRYDLDRQYMGDLWSLTSVGLGGNIGESLWGTSEMGDRGCGSDSRDYCETG